MPVLKPTELALSEWKSDIDSQMKIEMVDLKNKNLLFSEYIHSLFGEKKMWSLKILKKSLNFTWELNELFENSLVWMHIGCLAMIPPCVKIKVVAVTDTILSCWSL